MTKHKLVLISFFILSQLITSCGQNNNLTEKEKVLISELHLDLELMAELRELTDSAFVRISQSEYGAENFRDSNNFKDFDEKNLNGILIKESQENTARIINELRTAFYQKGHFIYLSKANYGYSPDEITILKTDDKFDLLRFEGTNGINYDIYVEDVIQKLEKWDNLYGLEFTGVGFDFFQAYYQKLPDDLDQHSKELYSFCPDIVDQGVGSVSELTKEIERSKELYLWWD